MGKNFESLDHEIAVQLCCLEIRRYFLPRTPDSLALDKKSGFEWLEKDVGLQKFLPGSLTNTKLRNFFFTFNLHQTVK